MSCEISTFDSTLARTRDGDFGVLPVVLSSWWTKPDVETVVGWVVAALFGALLAYGLVWLDDYLSDPVDQ
ncbi:MAG: hypothetical protein ABEL76_01510 [Bradymonadaceae bacterium]